MERRLHLNDHAVMQLLILGGISDGSAFALLQYVDAHVKPAAFVRLADKHLLIPSAKAYLTFVDLDTKAILERGDGAVECVQANFAAEGTAPFLVPSVLKKSLASRKKVFKPPKGDQFDYVFDLTGEADFRTPEVVLVEKTARIANQLGEIAALTNVKAYVRVISNVGSLFESKSRKNAPLLESDATVQPNTLLSKWHWEAVRALADIPNLNLVVARPGLIYGKPVNNEFTGRLLIAEIYKFISEDMQMLWSPDVQYNTLHAEDFGSAVYRLAQWMDEVGPDKALELAGAPLPPCRPVASWVHWLSGKKSESQYDKEDLDFLAVRDESLTAPLFNIVDDQSTTMGRVTEAVARAVGIKARYTNAVINQFAKLNIDAVVEEANEHHFEHWPLMLEKSVPPITAPVFDPSVVSGFVSRVVEGAQTIGQPRELMQNQERALDGNKIKQVTGWKPKHPLLTDEEVKRVYEKWKQESGVWPSAAPLPKK